MARRRTSRRNVRKPRRARSNIKIEMSGNLSKKDKEDISKLKCGIKNCGNGTGGCAYFLGFVGALIYLLSTATSVWDAIIGFLQAIVWPAILVYSALVFMGM